VSVELQQHRRYQGKRGLSVCMLRSLITNSLPLVLHHEPEVHAFFLGIRPMSYFASVIPISSHQDTVGPMCRSVADAAAVLSVIAGFDPLDNYTSAAPKIPDYTKALKTDALKGKRIGVPRKVFLNPKYTGLTQAELDAFEGALKTIQSLGATVVDNADLPSALEIVNSNNETVVLNVDFKVGYHVANTAST
jgi:amidase